MRALARGAYNEYPWRGAPGKVCVFAFACVCVCVFVCAWVRRPWVPRWHIIYEIEQLKGEYEVEHVHVRAR